MYWALKDLTWWSICGFVVTLKPVFNTNLRCFLGFCCLFDIPYRITICLLTLRRVLLILGCRSRRVIIVAIIIIIDIDVVILSFSLLLRAGYIVIVLLGCRRSLLPNPLGRCWTHSCIEKSRLGELSLALCIFRTWSSNSATFSRLISVVIDEYGSETLLAHFLLRAAICEAAELREEWVGSLGLS